MKFIFKASYFLQASGVGGLFSVTFILLRKERAIFGEEGNDNEELDSAPPPPADGLVAICGEKSPVDMAQEEERANGGGGGGISVDPGEVRLRLPLQ